MNERVKELADQAKTYARNHVSECKHYGYYMEHNEYDLRVEAKFAELIIKECCKTVANSDIEGDNNAKLRGEILMNITKHFGVEE